MSKKKTKPAKIKKVADGVFEVEEESYGTNLIYKMWNRFLFRKPKIRIKTLIINQSGSPPPLPPYGGG